MKTALLIAVIYWIIYVIDESFSWQALVRPIVTGPIVGFVLGDLQTGCIMGALIEAIYMGIVSVGGGSPADAFGATVICTTFVINNGLSQEAAIALAFPIGTLTARIPQLILPIHAVFIKQFDKYAEVGDSKSYARLQQAYRFIVNKTVHAIIIFFAIWLGADAIQAVFDALPTFILDGLKVGSNLLPALGLGILTNMIFNKELGAFLFIGFILNAYLGLDTVGIAILAGATAVIVFFADVEANSRKVIATTNSDEEDFFG